MSIGIEEIILVAVDIVGSSIRSSEIVLIRGRSDNRHCCGDLIFFDKRSVHLRLSVNSLMLRLEAGLGEVILLHNLSERKVHLIQSCFQL